jgi:hypothetical protein
LRRGWEKRNFRGQRRRNETKEAAGGSYVAHDLEVYITKEKRTCFNEILGTRKVGQVYTDP